MAASPPSEGTQGLGLTFCGTMIQEVQNEQCGTNHDKKTRKHEKHNKNRTNTQIPLDNFGHANHEKVMTVWHIVTLMWH